MRACILRLATAAVRSWTRLYTWRMSPQQRDSRRSEIESDLWESRAGGDSQFGLASQIWQRLLLGMLADMRWRFEENRERSRLLSPAAVTLAMATAAAALWIVLVARPTALPHPPAAPNLLSRRVDHPPPPLPPPPPCVPPGLNRPLIQPCTP